MFHVKRSTATSCSPMKPLASNCLLGLLMVSFQRSSLNYGSPDGTRSPRGEPLTAWGSPHHPIGVLALDPRRSCVEGTWKEAQNPLTIESLGIQSGSEPFRPYGGLFVPIEARSSGRLAMLGTSPASLPPRSQNANQGPRSSIARLLATPSERQGITPTLRSASGGRARQRKRPIGLQ